MQTLLDRLEGVRSTGPNRWIAKCPAHSDKSASLSLLETDDGRILLHDFAGCSAQEILDAVGLQMSDLFPERKRLRPRTREEIREQAEAMRRNGWAAALRVLDHEATLVQIAVHDVLAGKLASKEDVARLQLAVQRITDCRALLAPGGDRVRATEVVASRPKKK